MIRIGTRGSQLATTQTGMVADALRALGEEVELVIIRTEGDNLAIPLDAPPRPGAFTATLRDALLAGQVDVAVHSLKDLPSAPEPGLVLAAMPERADAREALVSRDSLSLTDLPTGAVLGTSSPRRAHAVQALRPDLQIVPIRGNVDTRMAKVSDGLVDATLLAAAGMSRIGLLDRATALLDPLDVLPAPAQGVLGVECRPELAELIARLDHGPSRWRATAERAVLAGIEATCTTALGAYCVLDGDRLTLTAELWAHQGVEHARYSATATLVAGAEEEVARNLGLAVAEELLAQ